MHARALVAAALLAACPAAARPFCSDPPLIPLLPTTGTRGSAVYETQNDIQPGDLACFKLQVPAAQTLHVTMAGRHDNAYFELYPPGWTIQRSRRSFSFGEAPLPGTTTADAARIWTGPLPQTGNMLIVVGMKQGAGQYRLHVEAY